MGLMINTNGSMITWPQAGISGLQTPWPIVCLEVRPHGAGSQQLLHTQMQLFSDGEQRCGQLSQRCIHRGSRSFVLKPDDYYSGIILLW